MLTLSNVYDNKDVDPMLKAAMEEIYAVLNKYDIGGTITLTSKTHSEYAVHFPDWAIFKFVGDYIHILCQREDYDTDEEQQAQVLASVHMILQMGDIAERVVYMADTVRKTLEEHGWEIHHEPHVSKGH